MIIGLTEGAAPLAPSEMGVEKVERIFRAAGIDGLMIDAGQPIGTAALERSEAECFRQLASARSSLEQAAADLVSTLRTDPVTEPGDPAVIRRSVGGPAVPDQSVGTRCDSANVATARTGPGDG